LFVVTSIFVFGQKEGFPATYNDEVRGNQVLRIAFYNVENLFDPTDDPEKNDDEFTPEGNYRWTDYKVYEKINKIAKVFIAIGGWEMPEIIGVCEIENFNVLEKIAKHNLMKGGNYQVVHYESPDRRGIDVGLIYRADKVDYIMSRALLVSNPENPNFFTRDILYFKGYALGHDTVHVYVNHWPSRYGGQAISEPKRILAASVVKAHSDSILKINPEAALVIMGDLNDEWDNTSILETLGAAKASEGKKLVNLMSMLPTTQGSHKYQGEWGYLDQIIVPRKMYQGKSPFMIKENRAHVFEADFLLETDDRYAGKKPFRQFLGFKFNNGFSDHLPIYIDLEVVDTEKVN
jgi:predicted extracellular nuclease